MINSKGKVHRLCAVRKSKNKLQLNGTVVDVLQHVCGTGTIVHEHTRTVDGMSYEYHSAVAGETVPVQVQFCGIQFPLFSWILW